MKKLGRIFTSRIAYHLYFWIFFFGLMFLSSGAEEESLTVRIVNSLEYIAFLIMPVYIHFFILDRFFYKKKYALYILSLVATLTGWGYIVHRFFYLRHMEKGSLAGAIVMVFFMLLITTSFKVLADKR